jgi:hypothetical protein
MPTSSFAKPFCPHCQSDWDRPWYDVCPSCGHRFAQRKAATGPLLLSLLGPAAAIAGAYLDETGEPFGRHIMLAGGFVLLPAGCLIASILLSRRTTYPLAGKIALGFAIVAGLLIVAVILTVAGIAFVTNRP